MFIVISLFIHEYCIPQKCRGDFPVVKCTYCRSEFQQERCVGEHKRRKHIPNLSVAVRARQAPSASGASRTWPPTANQPPASSASCQLPLWEESASAAAATTRCLHHPLTFPLLIPPSSSLSSSPPSPFAYSCPSPSPSLV